MKKKKKDIAGIITTVLALTVLVASIAFFTYLNFKSQNDTEKDSKKAQAGTMAERENIQPELVCMVNDVYMGIKQIPVPVSDKVYYGCCQNCVDKLQNDEDFRSAQDPATGEMVDKSEAYIVLKPGSDREVLYFRSEETFSRYSDAEFIE